MSIEDKEYVATGADIEHLAVDIFKGENGRVSYLRALVATTQAELGAKPRKRSTGNGRKQLSDEEVTEHLKAFQIVAKRFGDAVRKAAEKEEPDAGSVRLISMTTFARSAASTVRGYIRAGHDVRLLAARGITKTALARPRTKRKMSKERMKPLFERRLAGLVALLKQAQEIDADFAFSLGGQAIAETVASVGLAEHAVKRSEVAVEENLPWQPNKGAIYVPVPVLQ